MNAKTLSGSVALVAVAAIASGAWLAGCASSESSGKAVAHSPYGMLLQNAAAYVDDLRDRGQLPGFQAGEHGSLASIPEPVRQNDVKYPVTLVLRATKDGDGSSYRYTIMKSNANAAWQMVEATRWDKTGQVAERLLPK